MRKPPHTVGLRLVPQRHETDCSVAALATLFGVTYEEALLAVGDVGVIKGSGVMVKAIKLAAVTLGCPLRLKRQIDLNNDIGIAGIRFAGKNMEHVVILREGLIIDLQDMTVWDVDDYLDIHKAKLVSLLKF
jgi:hypothetical protein